MYADDGDGVVGRVIGIDVADNVDVAVDAYGVRGGGVTMQAIGVATSDVDIDIDVAVDDVADGVDTVDADVVVVVDGTVVGSDVADVVMVMYVMFV